MSPMMILRKKRDGYQPQTKIQKRIAKLPSSDLVAWAENSLYVVGRELTSWQKTKDKLLLNDVEIAAEVLGEIAKELKRR
jgi:hypothetical protein